MNTAVLIAHSWIRWIALVAVIGATLAAVRNQVLGEGSVADTWSFAATTALDVQMLLGLLLYFALSPITTNAIQNLSGAMQNAGQRFWVVEHPVTMFGALIAAHVGRVLARKALTPASKRTRLLVCFGLATVLIMLGMPWPGTPNERPLFHL
jgi:hypothetical protein